jgi:hypothetical protein
MPTGLFEQRLIRRAQFFIPYVAHKQGIMPVPKPREEAEAEAEGEASKGASHPTNTTVCVGLCRESALIQGKWDLLKFSARFQVQYSK